MARKHHKGSGTPAGPSSTPASAGVDPNVALFASYMKDEEQRGRDAKRAARQARQEAEAEQHLTAVKDAAAAEVKRLRGRTGVSAEERTAADVAYRDALAAVVAAETGQAPAWAPPTPAEETEPTADAEPTAEAEPETAAETATEADTGAGDEPAGDIDHDAAEPDPDPIEDADDGKASDA